MPVYFGLDIGSNSVGSTWVDTNRKVIALGVSVFPAGVEETEIKRGAPKNQKRRQTRSQRRSIRRRAERKKRLQKILTEHGLLPSDANQLAKLFNRNPWHLRRQGLHEELSPIEFGRVLVHLNQRRGAFGVETDPDDPDEGKVKEAIDRLHEQLAGRTFGAFMADMLDQRRKCLNVGGRRHYRKPIRNRRDSFLWHADRKLIHDEFNALWEKQKSYDGDLASILTHELRRQLDDPNRETLDQANMKTWRHAGAIFGQRQTYWDTGTLGRCDLEPTDRCCPIADMYAQHFRILETVNNIRIEERDREPRPLTPEERENVIAALRKQKTGSVATIRRALKIDKASLKKRDLSPKLFTLNVENDPDREINTDWFYREIVYGVFRADKWSKMDESQRDSVNRALLKYDPDDSDHVEKLRGSAAQWWNLPQEDVEKLVGAWKKRPKLEKRLNLSRRAIQNFMPYMNQFDEENNRWPTQIEARQRFAEDMQNGADETQRRRYDLGAKVLNKADRHFLNKHPGLLPPAPMLSNPVVRKAVHEVRRHLNAYLRRFKKKPDRIIIEFARGTKLTAKERNRQLKNNRERERIRKNIEKNLEEWGIPKSNWKRAVLRVRLCKEQNGICPFSITGENSKRLITEKVAAGGRGVEVEHIIPEAVTGGTMNYNNLMLCFRDANRNKGNRTPLDWLGREGLTEVLRRLEKTDVKKNSAKWNNLQKETPDADDYRASQLTDTAYTSRQVADYLRSALYRDEEEGTRRIFVTKGQYTSRLRADWALQESEIDKSNDLEPPIDEEALKDDPNLAQAARRARKDPQKERIDHRHHALDALVIALTGPELLADIGNRAAKAREYRERTGHWPPRTPVDSPKPWKTTEEFRNQALEALNNLVVSHRRERRRIIGAFHKEKPFGKANEYPGLFSFTIPATPPPQGAYLKPSSLKPPNRNETSSGEVYWSIAGRGQGSVVRDSGLRKEIIDCLNRNGKDPDNFSKDDLKELTDPNNYRFCMSSGVPIYTITMVRTLSDPVRIVGKDNVEHFYVGGNNHHMEILEDEKSGKWVGHCWDMFKVARRVRPPKRLLGLPMVVGRELEKLNERGDIRERLLALYGDEELAELYEGKQFVMSLSIGETVHMLHPQTKQLGYFVIYKLGKSRLFFKHHWDARPDQARGDQKSRESVECSPSDLKGLGIENDTPPCKVTVDPLGQIRWAND